MNEKENYEEGAKAFERLMENIKVEDINKNDRIFGICKNCGREIKDLGSGVNYDGTIYCSCCWDNEENLVAPDG